MCLFKIQNIEIIDLTLSLCGKILSQQTSYIDVFLFVFIFLNFNFIYFVSFNKYFLYYNYYNFVNNKIYFIQFFCLNPFHKYIL